jgi:ataxia telangiectasia mutated family protein
MEQCLENYLLSLTASDEHDNDALRFYAIWLENAESELANVTVSKHLGKIGSAKFARLMNQLSSRLQADSTLFQKLLSDLVFRICKEHPFHGMHHITAGTHDPGTDQGSSRSRHNAAKHIASRLKNDKHVGNLWQCIYRSDRLYHDVARYTDEDVQKQGREFRLDQFPPSKRLQENIGQLQTPPPTLSILLRPDMDYKSVPRVIGFQTSMRVAGGLSAPKIITSKLSDGTRFKQLFKGGNDDLRQDAIMEQVFEEVSKLLGNHTTTRQRKLRIRTYNVLPLSNRSGVLEFAQNTSALQDVVVPLHQLYHPKDLKSTACRQKISDASRETTEARIKAYQDVCKQFQPAMRYFFFERFPDPDVWFERRLAYTRSTAAMSILGYVIGLGDRHLHNILLDYVTGEVVHIDLGVCFEAGRVLPIPEVVPFRLTRDLVDGMGYTRTEGVYRRCCEFTLEALREERESIMTLLNVLRYDPLYSWTVSAAKAKRLQEADDVPDRAVDEANMMEQQASRKGDDEMGEAGRALAVVEKKLSKTLSKEATVSELIAQATDERNLALLFAGWSAWV